MIIFRRYCVTVMDNWTPMRFFWTRRGALAWRRKIGAHAKAWEWKPHPLGAYTPIVESE